MRFKDLLSFGPFHHGLPRVLLEQFFSFFCVFQFIDPLSLSFRLDSNGEGELLHTVRANCCCVHMLSSSANLFDQTCDRFFLLLLA